MKTLICIILSLASVAFATVDVPCEFVMANDMYTCRLPRVDLSVFDDFVITTNNHWANQSDTTVQSFISVNNNFQYYPSTHIVRFPNLVEIKVTGSNITEIPAQSIINRPLLRTLNLNSNRINYINPAAFTGTTGILNFHLMFNRLSYIDNAVFGQFSGLIELDLSSNLFTEIPQNALQTNTQLTSLSMSANQISYIQSIFFDNLVGLRNFNFYTNPCYSASFINLHTTAARNEMLRRLEPCFVRGPRTLSCQFGFQFQGVTFDGLYTCLLRQIEVLNQEEEVELTGLHIFGNSNANVHHVWIDISNVRYIINQIFITFPNLQRLFIQGSNLQYIQTGAFTGATHLQSLKISMNSLRRLEAYSFQHAVNLQEIYMWFNSLESINENAFVGLTNLRELHLFNGYLLEIPPNTFAPMTSLYLVEIGQNRLPIIDHRWFANNTMIQQLLFNTNQIDKIFPEIVDMPQLTTLNLRNNVCIDAEFTITDETRDAVRNALNECFLRYPLRFQRFIMDLEGDLDLLDEDGRLIISL